MFYKNLFENPSHIFGEVAQAARSAFIAYCNNLNSYRSVCLSLNPIGDPSFSVFLSKPKMFSNIEFANEEGNLQLITNVDSCNICITSLEDNGVGLYQFYDNISHIDLSQIQCASRICITKTGYVPYVIYYGVDYIQNEIIQNENRDYYTNNLKIGKNITNLKPIGNVLIKNSSLIIESNSFELHEGTTIIDSDIIVK